MPTKFALSAIFGFALLPIASVPASANIGSMTQAAAAPADTIVSHVAQRKGTGAAKANKNVSANRSRNVNVNKKTNVNRNVNRDVNVNRNVNVNRSVNVNRGLYTGRHVYTGGTWVRPGGYWWPVGGAVAAGAAIGFVSAATAAAWAGQPPGPTYCWYYTDQSRQQGFWDSCP